MIYYKFNSDGEYIGTSNLQTPLSTTIKPPECGKHKIQVWNGDKWIILGDYRGVTLYAKDMYTCTIIPSTFGDIPYGYTDIKPPELKKGETCVFNDTVHNWVKMCEAGMKYDENFNPVPMNERELVESGLLVLDPYSKIDGDSIVPKTPYELYDEKILTLEEANNEIKLIREDLYSHKTDKMYLMSVRGECTQQDWLDAIQAVKDKYPYIKEEENEGIS